MQNVFTASAAILCCDLLLIKLKCSKKADMKDTRNSFFNRVNNSQLPQLSSVI